MSFNQPKGHKNTIMRTARFYSVILLAVLTLVSCKKDDNNEPEPQTLTITASNIQVPEGVQIDEVWLMVVSYDYGDVPVAKVPFQNNGFSISFPNNVDSKYMESADDWWIPKVDPSIYLTTSVYVIAAYQGSVIGTIQLISNSNTTIVTYMFATAPFTVTGTASGYVYHIDMKAGWNQYAIVKLEGGIDDYTSTIPVGLTWRFSQIHY